jgi:hypothetical protein
VLKRTKVKLDENNLKDLGAYIFCCKVRNWIPNELDPCDHWACSKCGKPLVIRGQNGLWYHVGEKVFD